MNGNLRPLMFWEPIFKRREKEIGITAHQIVGLFCMFGRGRVWPRSVLLAPVVIGGCERAQLLTSGESTAEMLLDYFPWVLGATVLCLLTVAGTLLKKYPESYWETLSLRLLILAMGITVFLEMYLVF